MARKGWISAVALAGVFMTGPVQAAASCPAALICASNPEGIVSSLQAQGFKAVLAKSETTGNPKISSSAAGYSFTMFFYGCADGKECSSLSFSVTFDDDGTNSADLANEWNADKRFSAMSYDASDKTLTLSYDVTTVGGINQVNFADVVDWWQTMLGQARTFFDAHPAPKKK